MKTITIKKRANDYRACLDGDPAICGCGETIREAIGDLVAAYADKFDVEVECQKWGKTNSKGQGIEVRVIPMAPETRRAISHGLKHGPEAVNIPMTQD